MYFTDLGDYKAVATAFVDANDRALYRPFYDAAEAFCISNRFIFGGASGIDLLLGRKRSTPWDVYIHGDPFSQAKRFVNALTSTHSPHVPVHTLALHTNLKHAEYTISVAARQLIRLFVLPVYRGVSIADIIAPVTCQTAIGPVLVMPPDIQLISVYRDLYSPSKAGSWDDLRDTAARLMSFGDNQVVGAEQTVGGSADRRQSRVGRSINIIKHLDPADVIIGAHAAATILGVTPPKDARVQFISTREPADICTALNRIETVRSSRGGLAFTHVKLALNIDDWRLTKHTIYVSNGRDQHPVADVFNATTFEMIPLWPNSRCASVYAVMRFTMIDLWTMRTLEARGTSVGNRISELLARMKRLNAVAEGDPTARLPRDFVGVYTDEVVAKRQLIAALVKQGVRFHPFYPAKKAGGGNTASAAIDVYVDAATKQQILRKITGRAPMSSARCDVISSLEAYRRRQAATSSSDRSWGIGKTMSSYFYKNAMFVPWIPAAVSNYVDVGCGDGLDIVALGQRYRVGHAACADIADHRDKSAKRASEYVKVELNKPLAIADDTADLVTVFHSIHHMRDDVPARLADIVRITAPGGLIFIKDHDVQCAETASNVDFEHLVYMVAEPAWVKTPVADLMDGFATIEPMTYWAADDIDEMMCALGTERLDRREINQRTRVFGAVYRRGQDSRSAT